LANNCHLISVCVFAVILNFMIHISVITLSPSAISVAHQSVCL